MQVVTTKPQPARGRHFALRMGEVRNLVRSAGLLDRDGRSITIRHLNSVKTDPQEITLLRLFPEEELVVLSIPLTVSQQRVECALRAAIPELARLNAAGTWNIDQHLSFLVLLDLPENSIRIVRRMVTIQRRKYGSGSKRSTAFKPRKQSFEETVLQTLTLEHE